jgi:hypothetical protein
MLPNLRGEPARSERITRRGRSKGKGGRTGALPVRKAGGGDGVPLDGIEPTELGGSLDAGKGSSSGGGGGGGWLSCWIGGWEADPGG